MVEIVVVELNSVYLQTSFAKTENDEIGYEPVNAMFVCPITVSPATTPANANVPVDVDEAVVIVPRVTAPNDAVP
jgi:hypothetical protein